MEVYSIIGTIFLELLGAALASAAFLLFIREWRRHGSSAMLWFAGASIAQFGVHMLMFSAQYVAGGGDESFGALLMVLSRLSIAVHGFCVVMGVFTLRPMGRIFKAALAAVCAVAVAVIVYGVLELPYGIRFVQGIAFPERGSLFHVPTAIATLCGLVAVAALAVTGRREVRAAGKEERFSAVLGAAIVVGLGVRISTLLADRLAIDEFIFLALGLAPFYVVALTAGILAYADPDPATRRAPFSVFRRDLLLKSVSVVALVMFVMSFVIYAVISSVFIQENAAAKTEIAHRKLEHYMTSYEASAARLIEETARFAGDPEVAAAFSSPGPSSGDRLFEAAKEFIWRSTGARAVMIVDRSGLVEFAGIDADAVGTRIEGSSVIAQAVEGRRGVSIEKNGKGDWVLRAAVPVIVDGVVSRAAIMEESLSGSFGPDELDSWFVPSAVGLILTGGEVAYAAGDPIDRLFVRAIEAAAPGREGVVLTNDAGDDILARRVIASDGRPIGYVYLVQSLETYQIGIFRSVALVSFLVITATILTLAVIYFGLARALRPIRRLRDAAEAVEKERFGVRVDYEGIDELGQLAAAFNRMQDTIGRRTGELRTALREQEDFVDHTARELRNPVNIFRWTLELMRYGDTGRLNKDQLELLEQLHQTNERLFKVVQNLEDAVRIDRGRLTLKSQSVAMEDLVDEVAGIVAVRARNKGVTLHWNRPSKPLPPIRVDKEYLKKITHNIVSNAIKYTLKGGHVEVEVDLVEEASPGGKKGRYVRVSVEDNGIGIPQAEQSHIFERFYRAKNAVEGEIQGTGLGLYIAKHVIERLGGAIWFRSREEVGTTFAFTVPVDDVSARHSKN